MRYFRLYFLVSLLFYCCSFASAQQWIVYRDTNSALPTNWLAKIKIDKFDNKWMLSYNANDLIKFDGSTWTIYNHSNSGLPDTNLLSISIDKNDNKWIATKNGLVKFDNSNWTIYNTSNSCLPINQINDCDVDSSNNVWLATDLGIIKFDTSLNCALYNSANGALAGMNSTREIKIDSRNWVWSISAAAMPWWYLNSFDGITWHNYSPVNYGNNVSLSNFTLFCDSVGNVWSSSGMGILKYDGSIFSVPFDTSISVKFMSTGAVYANSNFIASAGLTFESLNYYSGGVWTYYSISNTPILYGYLTDISCDEFGNLWMTGQQGLYEFNPSGIVNGIKNIKNDDFTPYPNPTNGLFFIDLTVVSKSSIEFVLYDEYGRKVTCEYNLQLLQNKKALLTAYLYRLEDGIYCYQIITESFIKKGKILLLKK